jgi:CheY-like chemotaxis protein
MTSEAILTILDYFRNEAVGVTGGGPLLRAINDLRELLSQPSSRPATMEEFDVLARAGEIGEIVNLALGQRAVLMADAPAPSLYMTQDSQAVEQVLMRVLDSAAKLAPAGDVQVSIRTAPDTGLIRLAIQVGEPESAARLCEGLNLEAERAHWRDAREVPCSLALMVAGKRLRAMGGTAALLSGSRGPTAVTLDLPSCPGRAESVSSGENAGSGTLNILVAEDNDESFDLTQSMLQDERVWRARDGEEALHLMERRRFDVVFMDVHMPGIDGYAAIRKMRDWETQTAKARTPIVVLSADDVETQRKSAAACGCSGFLSKPLRRADLAPLMERLKAAHRS